MKKSSVRFRTQSIPPYVFPFRHMFFILASVGSSLLDIDTGGNVVA
ncbi:MAG: hypothetical protein KFH87_07915 [Bacteroidetes bacterium]|nr:hypothetical protein [Bacteroidota bacterium]